jgi:hypothetical protein
MTVHVCPLTKAKGREDVGVEVNCTSVGVLSTVDSYYTTNQRALKIPSTNTNLM